MSEKPDEPQKSEPRKSKPRGSRKSAPKKGAAKKDSPEKAPPETAASKKAAPKEPVPKEQAQKKPAAKKPAAGTSPAKEPPSSRGTVRDYVAGVSSAFAGGDGEQAVATEPWVRFRLGEGAYALAVHNVQEVVRVGSVTRVPHTAAAVRGVTNLRGRVLPVIDLGVRLGLGARTVGDLSRILVVIGATGPVGLLVDRVEEMTTIVPGSVQDVPDRLESVAPFARGVVPREDALLVLLELEPILRKLAA